MLRVWRDNVPDLTELSQRLAQRLVEANRRVNPKLAIRKPHDGRLARDVRAG